MDEMEFNKVFAAILIAGILAMLTGFVAKQFVKSDHLEEDAYVIEVADGGGDHSAAAAKPAGPEPIMAMLASADVEKGQKLSKACAACHSFEKGGPHRVGPNLWNVVNRDIGSADGFAYSDTFKAAEGNWDYEHLNKLLWKPKKSFSGTKMNYIGMKKPEGRAAIIGWLRTLSDSPAALP